MDFGCNVGMMNTYLVKVKGFLSVAFISEQLPVGYKYKYFFRTGIKSATHSATVYQCRLSPSDKDQTRFDGALCSTRASRSSSNYLPVLRERQTRYRICGKGQLKVQDGFQSNLLVSKSLTLITAIP